MGAIRRPGKPTNTWLVLSVKLLVPTTLWVALLVLLGRLVSVMDIGLDPGRESAMLSWLAQPPVVGDAAFAAYTGMLSQGLNGAIGGLRLLALGMLLVLATVLASALVNWWRCGTGETVPLGSQMAMLTLVLGAAITVYTPPGGMLPTPHWLSLLGALLMVTTLLSASSAATYRPGRRRRVPPLVKTGLMCGAGVGLIVVSTPGCAVAVALLLLGWCFMTPLGKAGVRFLVWTGLGVLFWLGAHDLWFGALPGPLPNGLTAHAPVSWWSTLGNGMAQLWRLPLQLIQDSWASLLLLVALTVTSHLVSMARFITPGLTLVAGAAWSQLYGAGHFSNSSGSVLFSLWLGLIAAAWAVSQHHGYASLSRTPRLLWVFLWLMLLPAMVTGQTGALIAQAPQGAVFAVAAGCLALLWIDRRSGSPWMGSVGGLLLMAAVGLPVWQTLDTHAALATSGQSVQFYGRAGKLTVDQPTARYITRLKQVALEGEWRATTDLIDLTGGSPVAALALGAHTPAGPWLSADPDGGITQPRAALAAVPAGVLQSAWVLSTADGGLDPSTLNALGLPLENGYEPVGTVASTPSGTPHTLFRPKRERPSPLADMAKQDIWVFIMAGQSNMAGHGTVPETALDMAYPGIYKVNPFGRVVAARHPLHTSPLGDFSMGIDFAQSVLARCGGCAVVLVPAATDDATSIMSWQIGQPAAAHSSHMIDLSRDIGTVKGILWHQGENDAASDSKLSADTYTMELFRALTLLRRDVGARQLPVILGTLPDFLANNPGFPRSALVNAGIRRVAQADKGIRLVTLGDMQHNGDGVHFDHDSLTLMGQRYGAAFWALTTD